MNRATLPASRASGAPGPPGAPGAGDPARHEQELLELVQPRGWKQPAPARRYNLVVVGAGTAGLVTATIAAGLGARVALVERDRLGGDCLNFGCVPSKALLRCARAAADARRAGDFGVRLRGPVSVDFGAVMRRMRELRLRLARHDSAARLRELGIDVFFGAGRFTGRDELQVNGAVLRFARACIATGSRPRAPSIPGLVDAGFLTNESVFSLEKLPRRLAVLGGGPIGCELAQAFARFGSEVVLLQRGARLLPREEPEASELVARALAADGVDVRLGTRANAVERDGARRTLRLEGATGPQPLEADALLVAAGRLPNVEGLGLEEAGVEVDRDRGVVVNDRLESDNRRIFAAGDVCSPFRFTHVADAHARIVVRNALFLGRARASALTIPWCTFTDPEVARVGLSAAEARERGLDFDRVVVPLRDVDRAVIDGEEEGSLQVLVESRGDRILGATLVARHAGEIISEVTASMAARAGLKTFSDLLHPYPTQAEALHAAGDARRRRALTPRRRSLLSMFLALRR
jgi:pyruvate/2-oxoglutarate dehydrogenase complex dihydrolipoamide dehydrogenase (E3) component